MTFLGIGEPRSMFRQWYSAIWAIHREPVLHLQGTLPQGQKGFTVNILSMHKVKTLLQESVLLNRLLNYRKIYRNAMDSLLILQINWKHIIVICRIWNLPLKTENCFSCRHVTESVRQGQLFRLPVIWWMKE